MIVWRFSRHESLDGREGLLASAQWHTRGREILYCAPNPATAVLEILVQAQVREHAALSRHRFIKLEIPDEISRDSVDESQLPTDWSRRISVTRAWGDQNQGSGSGERVGPDAAAFHGSYLRHGRVCARAGRGHAGSTQLATGATRQ